MGTAALIRSYRVRAGKSRSEVALQLGLNDAWYHDLEQNDDELASTLTLFQAIELASILGVGLHDLLGKEAPLGEPIPLTDLPARIEAHVARNRISIEQFEDEVGWALSDVLQSPVKAAAESPVVFFQVLAKHLGIDWLTLIPDDQAV